MIIFVLGILVFGIILFNIMNKNVKEVSPNNLKELSKEKQEIILTDVEKAFSGKGSYECRNLDGEIKYSIKDTMLKIEKIDGSSKIIIKSGKIYNLNIKTKEWDESNLREGIAAPGTGVYPKVELGCIETKLKNEDFDTK